VSVAIGWGLATLALAVGSWAWGWRGAVLALTVIAFWLLLQFSRAMRTLRRAAQAPVGHTASAVMLHARLHAGQRLADVLPLSGSLGRKLAARSDPPATEAYEWTDPGGNSLHAVFEQGRLRHWRLQRPAEPPAGREETA
jgi:hypothetical protein